MSIAGEVLVYWVSTVNYVIGALVLLLAVYPGWSRAGEIETLKHGVVKITSQVEGRRTTGAGFIVKITSQVTYVVTVAHVVEGDHMPQLHFYQQPSFRKSTVLHREADSDGLALLEVRAEGLPTSNMALQLGDSWELREAQEVTLMGFPAGGVDWAPMKARFLGREGRRLTFQGLTEEGNSGGPIIAGERVIGMVTASRGSFSYATSTQAIQDYLRGHRVDVAIEPAAQAGEGTVSAKSPSQGAPQTLTPAQARIQLGQLGLKYDAATFVRRAAENDAQAVALFLQAGMQPDASNAKDQTALMWAATNGHLELARVLMEKGADVNRALPWAAGSGQAQMMDLLLGARSSPSGLNAALRAAVGTSHANMVRALLAAGASVDAKDDKGRTALMEAASVRKLENVRLLLAAGADVNAKDQHGATALNAVVRGWGDSEQLRPERVPIVAALLEKGAAVNARDKNMVEWQPTALLTALDKRDAPVALLLLEHGADANDSSGHPDGARRNHSVLMWAADQGLIEVVKQLVAKGAQVNTRNSRGQTALMEVAGSRGVDTSGRIEIVRFLIASGAEINAASNAGWTALMRAADTGEDQIVRMLLELGAQRDAKNEDGQTALALAKNNGHHPTVRALTER